MIKVYPYIETVGHEKFRDFLAVPFNMNMLYPIIENNDILFDGWRGKDMMNWYKFTNDDNVTLEFYPNHYFIKKQIKGNEIITHRMPLPETINDFINDMTRFKITLYWSTWMDINFEPKMYLSREGIRVYFEDLLNKLDKSHELL